MKRRTKAEWQALITAQRESGLTAAAFCREQGVPANYFCRVRSQLCLDNVDKQAAFVPVSVSRSSAVDRVTVRCEGGSTVELPFGIEPRWVSQLLLALRD